MIITRKVKQIVSADVGWVSLVKHGANRLPTKMLKAEVIRPTENNAASAETKGEVMNIWDILKQKKSETAVAITPMIAGVYFAASVDKQKAEALVKEMGLKTDTLVSTDIGFGYSQGEVTGESAFIKHGDNVAIQVCGLTKAFSEWSPNSEDFADVMGRQALPAMSVAFDALRTVACNILYNGDDADSVKTKLDSALSEFSAAMSEIVGNIPVEAFKMEKAINEFEVSMKNEAKPTETVTETVTKEKPVETTTETVTEVTETVTETPPASTEATPPAKDAPSPAPAETPTEGKPDAKAEAGSKEAIETLVKAAIESQFGARFSSQDEALAKMATALETVGSSMASLTKSVKGTVAVVAKADRVNEPVVKNEKPDPWAGLGDTGLPAQH